MKQCQICGHTRAPIRVCITYVCVCVIDVVRASYLHSMHCVQLLAKHTQGTYVVSRRIDARRATQPRTRWLMTHLRTVEICRYTHRDSRVTTFVDLQSFDKKVKNETTFLSIQLVNVRVQMPLLDGYVE